ncbi:MAG TPA: ribose-phosphate pyrophosphokinase [Ignavibacteria bacterium]|nr:ribose-phosphate diphosphokinase [Bacteroidota bacterium]HRI83956.1 ribose-phosphate pyrophosphokinase [Ignavibacteria bacterium]HRJ98725.1 ribose-phosphate pyrophosphokinase [Ignavibacteria bacterium]
MSDLKIFAGRFSSKLGKKIAASMKVPLGKCSIRNFKDGEIWVKYNENIRGSDVFIVQSTIPPADNLMELLIMIDAAKRASARRVNAVIPYFGYARQDRKDQPRVSITAKLVANLITEAGADRVISMDLHASQIQGFFDIPVDHLYGSAVFMKKFRKLNIPNVAVVSPDVGGIKMARAYAKRLHADLIVIDKRRPKPNVAEVMDIIGDAKGKNIIIIDDLIDTGGTFVNAVNALKEEGANNIFGACTHAVFSGESLERINKSALKKLYVTDTLPLTHFSKKIEVVSVAEIFGKSIYRTNRNQSISSLFDVDKAL